MNLKAKAVLLATSAAALAMMEWCAPGLCAAEAVTDEQSGASTPPAHAQTVQTAPPDSNIAEVVVTANRRTESVQRVASTVSVLTGETIQERGVTARAAF